jgi:hypothetical protein
MATELSTVVQEVIIDDSQALPGAQRVVAAMDAMAAAGEQVDAANQKTASGLGLLDQAMVRLAPASESAARLWNRWAAAADPVEAGFQKLIRAEADLNRVVQQGKATEEDKIRVLDQLWQKYLGVAQAAEQAAAAQRAAASQGAFNQQLGVRDDFGGAARAQDVAAYGKALDDLRAKYNPLFAAQQQYLGQLAEIRGGLRAGALGQAEAAAAIQRTKAVFVTDVREISRANTAMTRGWALNRQGMLSLQASGVNTFQALASGMNPWIVAQTQAAQVTGALVQGGLRIGTIITPIAAAGLVVGGLGAALLDTSRHSDRLVEAQERIERAFKESKVAADEFKGSLIALNAAQQAAELGAIARAENEIRNERIKLDRLIADQRAAQQQQSAEDQMMAGPGAGQAFEVEIARQRDIVETMEAELALQKSLNAEREKAVALQTRTGGPGLSKEDMRAIREEAEALGKALADSDRQFDEIMLRQIEEQEQLAKKAADKAAREAEADQRRQVSLVEYIAGLEAAAEAEALGGVEKKVHLATLEAQNKLIDEQGAKLRDLTTAERGRVEAAVRTKDAIEEQAKAAEKMRRDQEKEAERQAELMLEPFKNAARGIQAAFTDTFENILSGGVDSFEDLAESAKRIMIRMAAEIASALVFQAVIQPVVGQTLGVGGAASGGSGSSTAGVANTALSAFGGGGGGFNFGSLLSTAGQWIGLGGAAAAGSGAAMAAGTGASMSAAMAGPAAVGGGSAAAGGLGAGVSAGLAAIPVWGWIALAAMAVKSQVEGADPTSARGVIDTLLLPSHNQWINNPLRSLGNAVDPIGTVLFDFIGRDSPLRFLSLGGILGGFGPKPSVGPNASGNARFVNGAFQFTGGAGDNGGDVGPIAQALTQVGTAVNQIITGLGATINETLNPFRTAETNLTNFPSQGGISATVFGGNGAPRVSRTFGSDIQGAQEFLAIGTLRAAAQQGILGDVSDTVVTAIKNSAATKLEDFLSDLDFADNLDAISEGLVEAADALQRIENTAKAAILPIGETLKEFEDRAKSLGLAEQGAEAVAAAIDNLLNFAEAGEELTQSEQVLAALAGRFAGLAQALEQFGVTAEQVAAAEQASIAKVREGFDDSISQALLAITDPMAAALEAFNREAERRVREAEALGADLVEVERLNALQRAQVIEQVTRQQLGGLQDFFNEITFGGLSGASPGASLEGVRATFQATAAQALAGDLTAQGRIEELGQQLIEASRGFFASSQGFQQDLDLVRSVVGQLVGANDNGSASVVQAINTGAGETARLLSQLVNEMSLLRQQVAALAGENARLNAELRLLTSAAA